MDRLELWGGHECTVNRVGDIFQDQTSLSGHDRRRSDLDMFADLGFDALRYPILWERTAPDHPDMLDWSWNDERLSRLRELAVRPIVGLVHHGSGPRYTDLLDAGFATGLARHAHAVAERYPWIGDWTPVNEPVTTARFSALYGHWYPHCRDERSFWLALLNQIDGVRLAMRAVRTVNAAARLIQTDDLGRTYATAAMRDQAAFDNVRRWAGWDMLVGRLVPGHPLWQRLCAFGFERRLQAIAEDPCTPDLIGVNHYLTSDRFLDHRVQRYPAHARGDNGRQAYADIEGVRVLQPPPAGLAGALRDAWERYGVPLAITEVHNGCTREEQLRWIAEAWRVAGALRGEGIDIRAVTSWALLGSTGWNTLLTAPGRYEAGAFDVSSGRPRETAMARLLRSLPHGDDPHPVLAADGWWRRPVRLHHPVAPRPAPMREQLRARSWRAMRAPSPILITGGTGTLGQALAACCRHREIGHVLTRRADLDLADGESIADALDRLRPWAVVNAAGWVRVDDAEAEPEACFALNTEGAARLARACAERDIPSVSFSSDLVFDGRAGCSYVESDRPSPLGVYGRSKAEAEQRIAALDGSHLVVRTAAFFSPFDGHNFAHHLVTAIGAGRRFRAAADCVASPTYVPDLCDAVLDLVIDRAQGLWHLTNGEALSWFDFAYRLADACRLDRSLIEPVPGIALGWRAMRPATAGLASERGALLPALGHAIERFAAATERRGVADAVEG